MAPFRVMIDSRLRSFSPSSSSESPPSRQNGTANESTTGLTISSLAQLLLRLDEGEPLSEDRLPLRGVWSES